MTEISNATAIIVASSRANEPIFCLCVLAPFFFSSETDLHVVWVGTTAALSPRPPGRFPPSHLLTSISTLRHAPSVGMAEAWRVQR